jgi:hypothetical protein
MLPDEKFSSRAVRSEILGGRKFSGVPHMIDYEHGGIAIQDPSVGHQYQVWEARVEHSGGNDYVYLNAPNQGSPTLLYSGVDISEISITFDNNMNLCLGFVEEGRSKLYWYDTTVEAMVTTIINGVSPRVFFDDKRRTQSNVSDILLFYIRGGSIYYRQQRDRYTIERLLQTGVRGRRLDVVGMGRNWRLQINTM